MNISIGCDHAGFDYKEKMKAYFQSKGFQVQDHGTYSTDSTDYPDYAHPVAADVEHGRSSFGILICGSGNGVCMTANKHNNVRAALCWLEEIAELARLHNDANVVCLPARFIPYEQAEKIADKFLNTAFEGGRHSRRVEKMSCN